MKISGTSSAAAERRPSPASVISEGEDAVVSRDRIGLGQIVYAPFDGGVVTAPTYGDLFDSGRIPKRWRKDALTDFLAAGVVVFPEGKTFFDGVFEVPPGHDLRITSGRCFVAPRDLLPDATEELGAEALPQLRERLADAVAGIGEDAALCLSGGLDSSSIAAAWARRGKPRCFVYGAPGSEDREAARETAAALRLRPVLPEFGETADIDELRRMLRILEIPTHIPGAPLPQFRLMEAMARSGVRTVVSGQGGDELFCGYPWHFPPAMEKLRARDPETAARLAALHEDHPPFPVLDLRIVRRCFTRTASWVAFSDGGACDVLGLSREDVVGRRGVRFFAADLGDWDALRRQGLTVRSLRYLLHYDRRLADHFGLRAFAPLLDAGVVDLVSRFRLDFLYGGGMLKYPLRLLFPEVPERVRRQTRKTGFWHSGPSLPDLRPEVKRLIGQTPLGEFVVRPEAVDRMNAGALWRFFAAGTLMEADSQSGRPR
jgi:asparagine synthetase B (glutamine-hydrolysing)